MKLFIGGLSGLLGLNCALQTREFFQVSGCYNTHPIVLKGVQTLKLDLTSYNLSEYSLRKIMPDVVINAVALTNVDDCEANPKLAHRLNIEVAQNIARIAASLDARLVQISTDQLFDGTKPWRTEADSPTPLNIYGKTKWQAEQAIQQVCPDALVIRTNFFGWGTPFRKSFSDWILEALAQQRELTMFSDAFFTPILINDLIDIVIKLILRRATGIFHVAGSDRITKYGFALKMAEVFGYRNHNIHPVCIEGFPLKAKRPKDMSLNSKKVEECLQITMPSVKQGIKRLNDLCSKGWQKTLENAVMERSMR